MWCHGPGQVQARLPIDRRTRDLGQWMAARPIGEMLHVARPERTYPELLRPSRSRLVVVALELGWRWSHEAATLVQRLVHSRARSVVPALRSARTVAFVARWSAQLAFAAARAHAPSLMASCFTALMALPRRSLRSLPALPPSRPRLTAVDG